ncbi:SsrA-binding protein SmpB [Candidatus Uhrbacteria bacterium]|nr:SsrA-binding protein SmpB [Candidatus Uhrbacteria bacterium]
MPTLATNKKAFFDYSVVERYEAGIVLSGQEVKSVRQGHMSLKGSFAVFKGAELYLIHVHISPYPQAGKISSYDPEHSRKLLLKKKELGHLIGLLKQKGLTLVPLSVYTHTNRIKIELGLCRGKQQYEKREKIKKQDIEREIRSVLKRKGT